MPEETGQGRTIPPTQRRREEARRQGQVAVSTDLTGSLVLLAGIIALWAGTEGLAQNFLVGVQQDLLFSQHVDLSLNNVQPVFITQFVRGLQIAGFVLGLVLIIGVAAGTAQAGFTIVPELVTLRWDRLSPAAGWQRLFSLQAGIRALTSLLKVAAIGLVAVWIINGRAGQIATLGLGDLGHSVAQSWDIAIRLALAIAGILVVVGIIDYALQRYRLERSLWMTPQELKDELKQEEGDPQVRARIRRLQREIVQRRMFREVPRATVVITNPIHLAIALRYDRATMKAPQVVAKGAGAIAHRIADIARRHGVPVIERKPLAEALHRAVQVGQDIPAALYLVVAELLAYVYRLRGMTQQVS